MTTKDLIKKVKEWNVNLDKHSPYIPSTQVDKDSMNEIIERLKEHDERGRLIDDICELIKFFRDGVK